MLSDAVNTRLVHAGRNDHAGSHGHRGLDDDSVSWRRVDDDEVVVFDDGHQLGGERSPWCLPRAAVAR